MASKKRKKKSTSVKPTSKPSKSNSRAKQPAKSRANQPAKGRTKSQRVPSSKNSRSKAASRSRSKRSASTASKPAPKKSTPKKSTAKARVQKTLKPNAKKSIKKSSSKKKSNKKQSSKKAPKKSSKKSASKSTKKQPSFAEILMRSLKPAQRERVRKDIKRAERRISRAAREPYLRGDQWTLQELAKSKSTKLPQLFRDIENHSREIDSLLEPGEKFRFQVHGPHHASRRVYESIQHMMNFLGASGRLAIADAEEPLYKDIEIFKSTETFDQIREQKRAQAKASRREFNEARRIMAEEVGAKNPGGKRKSFTQLALEFVKRRQ